MKEKISIGIDIGGTQTRVGFVNEDKILIKDSKKTDIENPEKNFQWVVDFIKSNIKKYPTDFIGISAPGLIDFSTGTIIESPNLKNGWLGFSLVNFFKKQLNMNVVVENDANIQGYAHAKFGAGKGYKVVQYFTISTGLGAGLVIDGKIIRGEHGYAQEVANLLYGVDGFNVGTLKPGSLESVASGTGILHFAKSLGLNVNSAAEVFAMAKTNPVAKKVIGAAKAALVKLFTTSIGFINPSVIVIDGSVATNNVEFVNEAIKEAEEKIFKALVGKTKYKISEYEGNAGIVGAANLYSIN